MGKMNNKCYYSESDKMNGKKYMEKMNNKCYYSESDKMNGKKYIEMMMPCDDEEGTGGSDDNDDSDGKDDQNVTPPLDWSSVMTASAASTSTCAKIVDCRHFLNLKDVQF